MAELPELGKHCSYISLASSQPCNLLDFLPFKCDNCKKIYCEEHRLPQDHNCDTVYDKVIPTCPVCNQIIYIKPGQDVNVEVNKHINAGCPKVNQPEMRKFSCTVSGCKSKELQRIVCPQCKKDFCSTHKYITAHACVSKLAATKPTTSQKAAPEGPSFWDQVSDRLSEMMKSFQDSDNPRARQQALIHMKQKATGQRSIPLERRFYLEVHFPMGSNVQPKLLYFDNNQVFGSVLDEVAESGRIKNQNNVSDGKKLQLLSVKTGQPFSLNQKLANCPTLQQGDTILLEYVNVK
jgi:predicted nucleic acid binding AN1-type Zn finger protein